MSYPVRELYILEVLLLSFKSMKLPAYIVEVIFHLVLKNIQTSRQVRLLIYTCRYLNGEEELDRMAFLRFQI